MPTFYIIDNEIPSAEGPFADADSLKEAFAPRADEDNEDCLVATISDDGTMTVAEVHDWIEEHGDDDNEN